MPRLSNPVLIIPHPPIYLELMEFYFNYQQYSDKQKVEYRKSLHWELTTLIQDARVPYKKIKKKNRLDLERR